MAEGTKTRTRRHTATPRADSETPPTYIQLAGDALLAGMTREQAIAGLISRVKRDQGYLAYRKACNRRTNYDDQVQQDMRALALAAVLLAEASTPDPDCDARAPAQRLGGERRNRRRGRTIERVPSVGGQAVEQRQHGGQHSQCAPPDDAVER